MCRMCVGQSSSPSKMCVEYTTVAPRASDSSRKKCSSAWRESTSRSVVTSSSSKTCDGRKSLRKSCARRLCPSETLCSRHSRSRSSSSLRRSKRVDSMPASIPSRTSASQRELAMKPIEKSAWKGTPLPTHATCRVQSPESSDVRVFSSVSWNAEYPSTSMAPLGTMFLPPSSLRSVVFPAPLAPTRSTRQPRASSKLTLLRAAPLPLGYCHDKWLTVMAASLGVAAGTGVELASGVTLRRAAYAGICSSSSRCTAQKSRPQPLERSCAGGSSKPARAAVGSQKRSLPLESAAMCVGQPSRPSKMCVQ
mmetsp:Transcript_26349/g.61472  ORF Transcript_26349/g.61472 Transcript_26349/m.61472 type:complete len:308 (-) Transcript_26349:762-1685(-)